MTAQDKARYLYLRCTQDLRPEFWWDLNAAWRSGDSTVLEEWAERYSVADEWLLENVRATLSLWATDPTGPSASLDNSTQWFEWDFKIPFQPVIDPFPRFGETHADYGSRVSKQFAQQLEIWDRRQGSGTFESYTQRQACEWLVRHQRGESYVLLGAELELSSLSEDPVQFVRRSAVRFAAAIGLRSTKHHGFCTRQRRRDVA